MSFGKFSIRDLARQQRRAAKRARIELDKAFATLPIPQYEYELAIQNSDMNDNDEDDNEMSNKVLVEPDRADLEAAEQEQLRIDAVKLYETRNSVLKRIDLPRPVMNSKKIVQSIIVVEDADDVHDKYSNIAVLMIRKEMQILLQHDASNFPITRNSSNNNNDVLSQQTKKKKKDDKKKKKRKHEPQGEDDDIQPYSLQNVVLDVIPENELDAAKKAVSMEYETLISEKIANVMNANIATNRSDALEFLANENYKLANQYASSMTYDDQKVWISTTPNDDVELEYKTLMNAIEELKKKNDKIETKKIHVMTNGYIQVRKKLIDEIEELYTKLQKVYQNEYIYHNLNIQETKSGNQRIQELQNKMNHVKNINLHMQHNYGNLMVQKRKLLLKQQQQQQVA